MEMLVVSKIYIKNIYIKININIKKRAFFAEENL